MIRFELSPQPCQPRVIESASHIRYPNFDYQSATSKTIQRRISDSLQYYQVQRFASTPRPLLEREKPAAKPAPQKTSAAATQHTQTNRSPQVPLASIRADEHQLALAALSPRSATPRQQPGDTRVRDR
jgi:hypothetical protein